ncbi:hypothetical protein [Paraburkholderia sp. RAU2J]|uniref:hypothetical protein n=1 Tax=Paraburkholderia sp. RAU2J TaxID=1938810 RepID=UPI001F53E723|nr:hypothetical protein [Paraburkholderia sp. RAU2J]
MTGLLAALRPGDAVVLWRPDRLGRSLKDLIIWSSGSTPPALACAACSRASILRRSIAATCSPVRWADFERNLIRARTRAGLSAARTRGNKGGRKKRLAGHKTHLFFKVLLSPK